MNHFREWRFLVVKIRLILDAAKKAPSGSVRTMRRTDSGDTMKHERDSALCLLCFTSATAVKAKLHILACDQPWGYGAVADANSGNTDQATYTIPHSFILTADAETWAEAFRVASRSGRRRHGCVASSSATA